VGGRAQGGKWRENVYVDFARICLGGYWVSEGEAGKGSYKFVERFDLVKGHLVGNILCLQN
jgi:hypothetical protein